MICKNRFFFFSGALFLIFFICLLPACDDDSPTEPDNTPTPTPTPVTSNYKQEGLVLPLRNNDCYSPHPYLDKNFESGEVNLSITENRLLQVKFDARILGYGSTTWKTYAMSGGMRMSGNSFSCSLNGSGTYWGNISGTLDTGLDVISGEVKIYVSDSSCDNWASCSRTDYEAGRY